VRVENNMKSTVSIAIALLMAALAAPAQEHDHIAMVKAYLAAHSQHGPVIPQPESVNPAVAKTFNMVAKSFQFDITPATFAVNQGDVVTINLSMPSNDPSADGHGLLMETYVEDAVTVKKGQTKTITFTATTVGHFQFACSVSTCGTGHFDMAGIFFVNPAAVPAPNVTALNPSSGSTAGGTAVALSVTNFQSGGTVTFGGVAATIHDFNSSTVNVTAPPHAAGAVDIVVTNPDGQSSTMAGAFTYLVPQPAVTAIEPSTGPTSGGTFVTIHGANFTPDAGVRIGALPASNVTFIDPSTLTALTPFGPASEQVAVKQDVTVVFPNDATTKLVAAFQYTRPALTAVMVTPTSAPPAGGTKISINGTGFTTALATSVTVGGVAATNVQVIDAVSLTATVPAHAVGPVSIVVNVGGTAVTVKGFNYLNAPPRRRSAHP
jgi:plastocyanin